MKKFVIPALLLSAMFITPADASWFHNPYQNINRNVGSAVNPTPEDLRLMRTIILSEREAKAAAQAAAAKAAANQPSPAQGGGKAPTATPAR